MVLSARGLNKGDRSLDARWQRKYKEVVFPVSGVCSLLAVTSDERIVEVATIGNEGFVGLPVFLAKERDFAVRL